ncbi:polysaccharide deacetylase family protein [Cytophagaceae bacterium DM2B3-1]|uniref:Polysaccharide deacetylase family protein n=1 Tax=Xanthocytophaga flava TaxID=3048013 RepID=A0ABT7CW54_9BACT|nr:polysaccharide deacetylase family protein [Xanthocytophaga flavus]MDJ1497165.1 polysaccharide deacetylase family protein [Xanthocytophaga flavus]
MRPNFYALASRLIGFVAVLMVSGFVIKSFVISSGIISPSDKKNQIKEKGAIVRGDTTVQKLALVFTGDEFGDGGEFVATTLKQKKIKASFFLTGNFYRNPVFHSVIKKLKSDGHYLGSHSDKHLLYCDWQKRDSLLVTKKEFTTDLANSYNELKRWNISSADAPYFLPPYEWYNDSIAVWTQQAGLQLVNFTSGTRSNADYTYPEMADRYVSSERIYQSILTYEQKHDSGLNGFMLLLHLGTDPRRTDKFYRYLPQLIDELQNRNYRLVTVPDLLNS